jgi:hypothetical protein
MALTCLPYLAALGMAKPGQYFAGFIWGVDDGNVYLSWIRQASEGALFLRDQYTTEPQSPHFFNVFLLALGLICRVTRLSPAIVFHIARVICGVFCLASVYALARHILGDRRLCWLTWAFAAFSSGFGWIIVRLAGGQATATGALAPQPLAHPVDYALKWQVQPEAITFLSLLLNPLFCFAMGLLCLVFLFALRTIIRPRWSTTLWAGVLLLVIGNAHSYDVFVVYGSLAIWLLWALLTRQARPIAILHLALIFIISLPGPAWAWYTGHVDPSYLAKTQTPTKSALPLDYALGYGLVFLLAFAGLFVCLRAPRGRIVWQFPAVWALVNAALLYAPVAFQRKMAEGLHIPLCLLAALALGALLWGPSIAGEELPLGARSRRSKSETALIAALVVLLTIPSNVFFISDCLGHAAQNNLDLLQFLAPPMYLSTDELAAMDWLGQNARATDVVLSSSLTGNHIPAHAGCLVYTGHWAETLHYGDTLKTVALFYVPGQRPDLRREALQATRASYVYYSPYERLLAQGVSSVYPGISKGRTVDDLSGLPGLLQPVERNPQVTIFKVGAGAVRKP